MSISGRVPPRAGQEAPRDRTRTVLVVAERPALWARVRNDLPERLVLVRACDPGQVDTTLDEIDPWPWLLVGKGTSFPPRLAELTRRRPIPVLWWDRPAPGLPPHARCFADWRALLEASRRLLDPVAPGFRLLPVRGLETTTCHHLLSAELEALVAAYPSGLPIESRSLRRVNTLLQRHGIDWRVERQDGVAVLLQTIS
ncbi:MAG TPA: hypothetical protein VIK45_11685 [Candidatus Dormibacteraeota bacterium]